MLNVCCQLPVVTSQREADSFSTLDLHLTLDPLVLQSCLTSAAPRGRCCHKGSTPTSVLPRPLVASAGLMATFKH